jgi:hypothetical protein
MPLARRFVLFLTVALTLGLSLASVRAAELVMVEQPGCPWCQAFNREIAPIYARTPEGQRAPLRRIQLADRVPADLSFLSIERLTPLFILVDQGREIGRIRGYPGPEGFWTQLAVLMGRLPQITAQADMAKPVRATD